MEKLTAQQILDIVEANMSVSDFAYCDYRASDTFEYTPEVMERIKLNKEASDAYYNHPTSKKPYQEREADEEYKALYEVLRSNPKPYEEMVSEWLNHLGLGEIVEIEQYGGEDQGSTWYSIKHFVDHDVYIQTDGYYSSYSGTDFYEGYGYEVKPVQVMVTQYKAV